MKKKKSNPMTDEWITPELRDYLLSDEVIGSTVLSPDAPLVDKIKWNLCAEIVKYRHRTQISQEELAKKLDVDAPEMSRLLHYKIERYTIDRLIKYVAILYPKLKIEVKAA